MVRQIKITVPHEKASTIRDILQNQKVVHHLEVYMGETSAMIICKVVNKKTDDILQLLARYSVGIGYGHIDVVALTSTKPRIATFRGIKPKKKNYLVSDRMSYDEMVDFIDSQIHLTFDYLALIVVGAMICAGGLLTNSAVNVVASMLVSPLMGPIVGMTFGTIVKDKKMFWVSFRNECLGLFTCWACGVFMGFLVGTFFDAESDLGPYGHNTEMSSRGEWQALAWGAATAIPSGLGVALGSSSYTVSALIGVAISAALLPPIVNSGVCLGASFIMYFVPSQPDTIIVHDWIIVGLFSMALFLLNWLLLYLSALVMFRIKNLNYHANEEGKKEKLAQFSKLVDEGTFLSPTVDNLRDRAITAQVPQIPQSSSASLFSGGGANVGTSSNVAFETNIQSSTSILRGGTVINLQTPLLEDDSVESAPIYKTSSAKAVQAQKYDFKGKSTSKLIVGSTKGNHAKNFNYSDVEIKKRRPKSHSTTNLNIINNVFNASNASLLSDGERLTQSAEIPVLLGTENVAPLQLRKGSK